jgi:hypothetical protein
MQHWWNDSDRGKLGTWIKPVLVPLYPHKSHTLDWLEINLALHSGGEVPEPWDGQ